MRLAAVGGTDLNYLNMVGALTSGTNYSKAVGTPENSGTSAPLKDPSSSPLSYPTTPSRSGDPVVGAPVPGAAGSKLDLNNIGSDVIARLSAGYSGPNSTSQASHYGAQAQQNVTDLLNALKDKEIDPATKQDLVNLYKNNNGASNITERMIADARAGKGLFGVRKVNFQEAAFLQDMPGRSQLVSLGKGKVLGK